MNSLNTVCMFLGPYRNLTSLTASALALHPEIRVLNHGAGRVFPKPELNFTRDYSPQKFDDFCEFALSAAQGGARGAHGGSITLSAAFQKNAEIKACYERLYPKGKKMPAKCLIWKESQRLLFQLKKNKMDFDALFARNDKIKFLVPVRHLFDCASSNYITGHYEIGARGARKNPGQNKMAFKAEKAKRLEGLQRPETETKLLKIIEGLLRDYAFIHDIRRRHPDRVMFFFEHDKPENIMPSILAFLNLKPKRVAIKSYFKPKPSAYEMRDAMGRKILNRIEKHFPDDPDMQASFAKFFR